MPATSLDSIYLSISDGPEHAKQALAERVTNHLDTVNKSLLILRHTALIVLIVLITKTRFQQFGTSRR